MVSIFAVALMITVVLVLVGISNGTLNEVADRLENVGADVFVLPPGSSPILTLNSATVPARFVDKLVEIPGVKTVSPVLTWTTKRIQGQIILIYGIDPVSFASVGGSLVYVHGRELSKGPELVIDKRLADANGFKIGDKLDLLNNEFTIVGICKPGIGARIYMHINTLQDLIGQPGKASIFFVKCASNQSIQGVVREIESRFTGYQTHTLSSYYDIL
jgi:putative ABC transport system permease protein